MQAGHDVQTPAVCVAVLWFGLDNQQCPACTKPCTLCATKDSFMIKSYRHKFQLKKALLLLTFMFSFICADLFSQTPITTNKVDTILFNNFLFTQRKTDTVTTESKLDFYNYLNIFNCLSGTVYFSGNGFPSIVAIQYRGKAANLKQYFEKCVSGSKFTLDNCSFERDGGLKPIFVIKTVIFR